MRKYAEVFDATNIYYKVLNLSKVPLRFRKLEAVQSFYQYIFHENNSVPGLTSWYGTTWK